MPRDGEGGRGDVDGGHLLAGGDVAYVDGGVLGGRGQQLPVVAEGTFTYDVRTEGEGVGPKTDTNTDRLCECDSDKYGGG